MSCKQPVAKKILRLIAIELSRGLLKLGSKPYLLPDSPTVIIAPHQDDETLACGGLIARKRNEGLPVHVIFITNGAASHPGHTQLSPEMLAALRHTEATQALGCLGVERNAMHFLDEPDGTLKTISPDRRQSLVARLAGVLGAIAPGEVFLPCNPDGSSEHDATFGFVIDAIAKAQLTPRIWQYPVWAWWNPPLLIARWLATSDCRRLELEDYRQHKNQAIQCYQTQVAPIQPDVIAALPRGLLDIFRSDTEYFFRYDLKAPR